MSIDITFFTVYTEFMDRFKIKKADVLIAAAVLIIAAAVFLCTNLLASDGGKAVVEKDGNVIAELPLSEDAIFEVEDGGTVTNVIEVKNGKVSVISASCPDKICQNHRAVSKSGESIVCLPNKVIVNIEKDDREVDGVAW